MSDIEYSDLISNVVKSFDSTMQKGNISSLMFFDTLSVQGKAKTR